MWMICNLFPPSQGRTGPLGAPGNVGREGPKGHPGRDGNSGEDGNTGRQVWWAFS